MKYSIAVETGISDYYFCKKAQNPSNPAMIHSHIEFIFGLEGPLEVTVENNTYILNKGSCMVIMPYQVHSYLTRTSSEVFFIACPPDYISEYKQILTTTVFVPPISPFDSVTSGIISELIHSDFKDDFKKKALLYYSLSGFFNNCESVERLPIEFDVFRRGIAHISEHFKENITLESVASSVGVTPSHLSRVLNKGNTSGFSNLLNTLRIYHAKQLLETTDLSVSEIAFESGYNSIRNFNRFFYRHFGCTPKEIKNNSAHKKHS